MKYYRRMLPLLPCALWTGFLSGCGGAEAVVISQNVAVTAMENTPVTEYAVPRYGPNIIADMVGYSRIGGKTAVVKGRNLTGEFRLVEDATDRVVYTGWLEDTVYHEASGIYSGYADFSEFQEEGTYYLECDGIGQSYRFFIRKGMYAELFQNTYEQVMENCTDGTLSLEEAVNLLEVYEWYPGVFLDEDSDTVPDMLKEMRGWVAQMEEKGVAQAEEALYSAFLAKFGYLYRKFDVTYATECLKRASTVFGQAQEDNGRDADRFLALAELYRATGLDTYGKQIPEYKDFYDKQDGHSEERAYLYAVMTYMSTRQRVNMEMCETFMNHLMDEAEEVSKQYTDMIHPVTGENNGQAELLRYATEVSCANYIMNNYQYTRVTEEFLHYLMGRNAASINLYAEGDYKTEYLLLLAPLAENERKKEQEGK
ncbi:MAG: cellulase N-terminal Ig-like domain-containing protein [Acetatifactor sp.]